MFWRAKVSLCFFLFLPSPLNCNTGPCKRSVLCGSVRGSRVNGPFAVSPQCHLKSLGKRSCTVGLHLHGQSRKHSKLAWKVFFDGILVCFHTREVTSRIYRAIVAKRPAQPCQNLFPPVHLCRSEPHVYVQFSFATPGYPLKACFDFLCSETT